MKRALQLACLALAVAAAAATASSASASRALLKGVFDEAETLGRPQVSLPMLRTLRTEVVRTTLYWGGRSGVARRKPVNPADPADPAYRWEGYDSMVSIAAQNRIKVVFSITATPTWANGGRAVYFPPRQASDLRAFAAAAAKRYSGTFKTADGTTLPAVRMWLAWSEPNNPAFLRPQYRRVRGKWVIQSALEYAKICNAVYAGVHSTLLRGQKVACGVTAPRGNNQPTGKRPAVSPLPFLRAMKRYGAKRFDAYAHHPYYGKPNETPTTRPPAPTAVTLANIDVLVKELTRLYGRKRLWITEYGYQTRPQDRLFGVSYALQARYLTQAFAIARKHPRIDMMLWFLLRDQPRGQSGDWQSGFLTVSGARKPSFRAFQRVNP